MRPTPPCTGTSGGPDRARGVTDPSSGGTVESLAFERRGGGQHVVGHDGAFAGGAGIEQVGLAAAGLVHQRLARFHMS